MSYHWQSPTLIKPLVLFLSLSQLVKQDLPQVVSKSHLELPPAAPARSEWLEDGYLKPTAPQIAKLHKPSTAKPSVSVPPNYMKPSFVTELKLFHQKYVDKKTANTLSNSLQLSHLEFEVQRTHTAQITSTSTESTADQRQKRLQALQWGSHHEKKRLHLKVE